MDRSYAQPTDDDVPSKSGYLYKKSREGQWQKRWFETNGAFLTYYKSKKMTKLLAALSLPQVGDIQISPPNEEVHDGSMFTLELNDRIYTLKADTAEESQQWVATLNQLKQGKNSVEAPVLTMDGVVTTEQNAAPPGPKTAPGWKKSSGGLGALFSCLSSE